MREIKFRAYNNQVQKMTDWSTIKKYRNLEKLMTLDHVDLMQYTGLKDKNGVEIYESDIVRFVHEDYFNHEDNTFIENEKENGIGHVKWGGHYPAFDIFELQGNGVAHECEYNIFSDDTYRIEVIGNIYENKELLNGKM